MLITEERDAVQLKKAEIKTNALTGVLTSLIQLNNELDPKEQKAYTTTLNYTNFDNYYEFIADIRKTYSTTSEPLMRIRFSLKNLDDGLNLFDGIRDAYIQNCEMIYTGFSNNSTTGRIDSFDAVGTNKIDLKYKIHNWEEYERLQAYEDSLYKKENPARIIKTIKFPN